MLKGHGNDPNSLGFSNGEHTTMATQLQPTHRPETYASLQQRIAQQHNSITSGLAAGKLSPREARAMREQLARVEARLKRDAFDGNGLTHGAAFDRQLDRVHQGTAKRAGDVHMDLDKRFAHTQARIDGGLKNGSLTPAEGAQLNAQLAALKQRYAGAQIDKLSPAERADLSQKLRALNQGVSHEARDAQTSFGKQLANMKARIAAGLKDGTLNAPEARRLTAHLDTLKARLDGARLDNTLTDKERSKLAAQFQGLSQRIFTQRHDTQADLTKLSATVGQRIDAGLASRKLTPAQATALRNELAALQQAAANPALNATQRANLVAQLNTLAARVTAGIRG